MTILGLITSSSEKPFSRNFEDSPIGFVMLFHPALFNTFNIISGETSSLYNIASYLLPASLVLHLKYQFRCIKKLGLKLLLCFGWNFRYYNRRSTSLIHCGSFYPEVALSNGEKLERTIDNSRKLDWWRRKSNHC
jgi:hypothetical protein